MRETAQVSGVIALVLASLFLGSYLTSPGAWHEATLTLLPKPPHGTAVNALAPPDAGLSLAGPTVGGVNASAAPSAGQSYAGRAAGRRGSWRAGDENGAGQPAGESGVDSGEGGYEPTACAPDAACVPPSACAAPLSAPPPGACVPLAGGGPRCSLVARGRWRAGANATVPADPPPCTDGLNCYVGTASESPPPPLPRATALRCLAGRRTLVSGGHPARALFWALVAQLRGGATPPAVLESHAGDALYRVGPLGDSVTLHPPGYDPGPRRDGGEPAAGLTRAESAAADDDEARLGPAAQTADVLFSWAPGPRFDPASLWAHPGEPDTVVFVPPGANRGDDGDFLADGAYRWLKGSAGSSFDGHGPWSRPRQLIFLTTPVPAGAHNGSLWGVDSPEAQAAMVGGCPRVGYGPGRLNEVFPGAQAEGGSGAGQNCAPSIPTESIIRRRNARLRRLGAAAAEIGATGEHDRPPLNDGRAAAIVADGLIEAGMAHRRWADIRGPRGGVAVLDLAAWAQGPGATATDSVDMDSGSLAGFGCAWADGARGCVRPPPGGCDGGLAARAANAALTALCVVRTHAPFPPPAPPPPVPPPVPVPSPPVPPPPVPPLDSPPG